MESTVSIRSGQKQKEPAQHVAAIDFGTRYSGYAFTSRSDFLANPLRIGISHWKEVSGRTVFHKSPSCILFDLHGNFHSFGANAKNKYTELSLDNFQEKWFFFERFKTVLFDNQDLKRDMKLKDVKGLEMSAMKVFTETIRYFKDRLLDSLHHITNNDIKMNVIKWVITVPAMWDDNSKQFIREAAENAGISPACISLALEPEAALLFCKYLAMNKIEGAYGNWDDVFTPGSKCVVLDAGGGLLDIIANEAQSGNTFKEIYKATGGMWEDETVEEAFKALLTRIVGKETMDVFIWYHKEDYRELIRKVKKKKHRILPSNNNGVTFRIPESLDESSKMITGRNFRLAYMREEDVHDYVIYTGNTLCIHPPKFLLKKKCDTIVGFLNTVFSQYAVRNTKTILFVGGLAISTIVQEEIRKKFPLKRLIVPKETQLAVLKGAVLHGHSPTIIEYRIPKYTYGIRTTSAFDIAKHEIKRLGLDGRCHGCFSKHVEMDVEIPVGKAYKEKLYFPVYNKARTMSITMFIADTKNPKFVDEPGCIHLGSIDIDVSGTQHYRDKKVGVKLIYGGAELQVEARIVKTNKQLSAKFDFL